MNLNIKIIYQKFWKDGFIKITKGNELWYHKTVAYNTRYNYFAFGKVVSKKNDVTFYTLEIGVFKISWNF